MNSDKNAEDYANDFGPFAGRIWFNTAHQGPLPRVAVAAVQNALAQRIRPSEIRDDDFFEVPRQLRELLGNLIGASAEDIILGNSTTYGLDLLANGIRWLPGDEILLVDGDFPANIFSWSIATNRGVTIRLCKPNGPVITPERLAEVISPRTRLFCTTWVDSYTGHTVDINALGCICRQNGTLFVLNGSQAVGAKTLNVQKVPIDALTCCGYKWLCGPYGTGFCWFSTSLRDSLSPQHAYWLPMQEGKPLDRRDYTPRQGLGARAWDVFCTANFMNFRPWIACLKYFLEQGLERITSYDQQLVERLILGLDRERFDLVSPEVGPHRSTLIVVRPVDGQSSSDWNEKLAKAGIDVAIREGNLRIAPHLHNTVEDVDRLLQQMSD